MHVLYADEKVRENEVSNDPDVTESEPTEHFQVLNMESLVRNKLTAYRLKDRVHIQDMIEVGLIDATWLDRLPGELRERLQYLLDNPDS